MNETEQVQIANLWLERLTHFCRERGGVCYANWSPETLRDYLAFHVHQKTLVWARHGEEVIACGVAWQTTEFEIRNAAEAGRLLFDWTPTNPEGDAVFVADWIANDLVALSAIVGSLLNRNPDWLRLKTFTFRRRHGREELIEITPRYLKRMLKGWTI